MKIHSTKFLHVLGLACAGGLVACGGGSSGTDSTTTGSTVQLTGTVEAPTASASISAKGVVHKSVSSAAAADLHVIVYNLDGDEIGTATTDSTGKCTIDADLAKVKPADATSTSWTAELVLVATNDAATVNIETYVEVSVDESSTSTISLGTANAETTLAAQTLRKKIGCSDWGKDCKTGAADIDPYCLFLATKQMWSDADASAGTGIADDLGIMKDMIKGAMATGDVTPLSLGFNDWGEVMNAALAGSLDSTDQSALATAAAEATGISATTYVNGYSAAATTMGTLDTVLGTHLAAGSGLSATGSVSKAATTQDESLCADLKDSSTGSTVADALIGPILASADATACANVYGKEAGFKVLIGLMNEYETAGDYTGLINTPGALYGFLANVDDFGTYFESDGSFDASDFDVVYKTLGECDTTLSYTDMLDWGTSLQQQYESLDGGYDALLKGDGTIDTGQITYYDSYFEEHIEGGTYDPSTTNFTILAGQLESQYTTVTTTQTQTGGVSIDTCIHNGGTFESCGGSFTTGITGGPTPPPPH